MPKVVYLNSHLEKFREKSKIKLDKLIDNLIEINYNKNIINEFMIIPPFYIPLDTKNKLIDYPVKFLIKSERNCGSNYFEQLISYYFNCNYINTNYYLWCFPPRLFRKI